MNARLPRHFLGICLAAVLPSAWLAAQETQPPWQAWPERVRIGTVRVKAESTADGRFLYITRHFRFGSTVNLGNPLMTELARIFELTHNLHTSAPFGILATPVDEFYQATLYGGQQDYELAGGRPHTSGNYRVGEKAFLARLDMMGVVPSPTGWRLTSRLEFDPSPIVHELTHMLTHEMVVNLPVWLSEGYAEYISAIPLRDGIFNTTPDSIKAGVLAAMRRDCAPANADAGSKPLKLLPVAEILKLTDADWDQVPKQDAAAALPPTAGQRSLSPESRFKLRRYRTAHLIIYSFIHLDGDAGVAKIWKAMADNRENFAAVKDYQAKFKVFRPPSRNSSACPASPNSRADA